MKTPPKMDGASSEELEVRLFLDRHRSDAVNDLGRHAPLAVGLALFDQFTVGEVLQGCVQFDGKHGVSCCTLFHFERPIRQPHTGQHEGLASVIVQAVVSRLIAEAIAQDRFGTLLGSYVVKHGLHRCWQRIDTQGMA
jgi:hypothetical protein